MMGLGLGLKPYLGAHTPLVRALKLSLNFLSSVLDPRITFTRPDATTCATYFGSDGLLKSAAANVPRFDYDPATPAGVTGPELVTNGDFSDGGTGWGTPTGVVVSGGVATWSSTGGADLTQPITISVGRTYAITFRVTAVTGTPVGAGIHNGMGPFIRSGITRRNTTGTFTEALVATQTGQLTFNGIAIGASSISIDDITIKEVTFAPRGLLIEESRANLLLHSRDMTNAAWTKSFTTAAKTQVGIDGAANSACLLTETATTNVHNVVQTAVTVPINATIAISFVAKAGTRSFIGVYEGVQGKGKFFDLANGTVLGNFIAAPDSAGIENLGGGWYRCTIVVTAATAVAATPSVYMSPDGTTLSYLGASGTVLLDCAQLEVGAFAKSIIPTTTAAVTRAADGPLLSGSGWYNAAQGTWVVEFDGGLDSTQNGYGRVISGSAVATSAIISTSGSSNSLAWFDGVLSSEYKPMAGADYFNTHGKAAFAYGPSDTALTGNGLVPITSTQNINRSHSNFMLGGNYGSPTNMLNGHILRLRYYNTRLSNGQLQALTA